MRKSVPSAVKKKTQLPSLSVFFPCYNEEKNIPIFVADALTVLPTISKKFEIIIVNDGSNDHTKKIAQRLAKKHPELKIVHHEKNKGYGASLLSGFKAAQYEWVFFTDGDLQFALGQLALLVKHTPKYQVVIGYRKRRADGFVRSRNAWLYKKFIDLLFRLHVKDIDCAFKLLKKEDIDSLNLESNGAFISAEMLYKLKKKKIVFKQVPVDHFPRKFGKPTGANFKVILKACVDAVRLYLHMKFHLFNSAEFLQK